jgi:hypothetical protein
VEQIGFGHSFGTAEKQGLSLIPASTCIATIAAGAADDPLGTQVKFALLRENGR